MNRFFFEEGNPPDAPLADKRNERHEIDRGLPGPRAAGIDPEGRRFRLQERLIPPQFLLLATAAALTATRNHTESSHHDGVLFVGGFVRFEIGSILPLIKRAGGPALTAAPGKPGDNQP